MSTAAIAANIPQAAIFLVLIPVLDAPFTVFVLPVIMKLLSALRRKTGADRPLIHNSKDRPHGLAGVQRIKKAPDQKTRGARIQIRILFFSHPDCNCRYRNSHAMPSVIPLQTRSRSGRSRVTDSFTKMVVADYTAGGNFHPAPKNSCFLS